MPGTVLSFYKNKYTEYSELLSRLKHKQKMFVFARLLIFGLMVFLPLAIIKESPLIAAVIFIFLLTLFLYLVKKFSSLDSYIKYVSCLLDVNLHEIEASRGNFGSFDDGSDFTDPDHRYSFDLDLFGKDSLFQYINRCCTLYGKEKLAGLLLSTDTKVHHICKKQKAFRELSSNPGFCQHFIATGNMHKEVKTDKAYLLEFVNSSSRFTRNFLLVILSRFLPVLTLVTLVVVIAGLLPFYVFIVMFLLQLGISGALLKRVNEMHALLTNRLETLKKYGKLLQIIQTADFDAPLLKSLQRHLKTGGLPPSAHIKSLAKIAEAFDNRLNIIAGLLLNGLFLWDINCVLMIEKWKRKHRKQLPVWLDSIGRMDAFISMSVYTFNNPGFVFPRPSEEGPVLYARSLGHPLISQEERVCNDFSIDQSGKFVIVTGANMAGKSTFLRTAGTALILSMAGAPVCASVFHFRVMEVYSSMRTNDSLSRHESYFYAELKRLKHLMERIAEGKLVFVILDEILKGTNSSDKQKGSAALLEQMIKMEATGIVATHDLSLTTLEDKYPDRIQNKCFEVKIDGDKIYFDYRLRDGVTRKMNAMILMKQMGLLGIEQHDAT